MKKLFISLIVCLILVPSAFTYKLSANDGEYELDYIEDDGSFTKVSTYETFEEAKKAMNEKGGDHVVRHYSSLSPSKIIAMNSGVVYSYPGRSGTNTMNIYQNASERNKYYKQTYVSNHYEMTYVETERYLPKYNGGIVKVILNGFEGYADLEYTDLVPDKFLDKGIGLYLGGNNTYDGEEAFYVVPIRNYYEVVKNGEYLDLAFHYSRAYPENGNKPATYTLYIGKAPSFMKTGQRYYSANGVDFYTDSKLTQFLGTYYNYYQFLPLRTKSSISADSLEAYLNNGHSNSVMKGHCSDFINAQNDYGVNSLLLFSMACHESAYGTSAYATKRYNLFGWNAVDADPSKASYFDSVSACVSEQAGINLRGYLDITDGRFFSSSLGNKASGINVKYASDPYWSMKIAGIAYNIDKFAAGKNGQYVDYDKYSLAIVNKFDAEVKEKADSNSKTLYTTAYGPYYQKDFIVTVLEKGESFTKIQSTNAIENGNILTHRTPITIGDLNPINKYDFENSVAYIDNSYLTYLTNGQSESVLVKKGDDLSLLSSVENISMKDGKLIIEGLAFIKNMDAVSDKVSHTLSFIDMSSNEVYTTYKAETFKDDSVSFNDEYIYDEIAFKVVVPLSEISNGNYYLKISVLNDDVLLDGVLVNFSTDLNSFTYQDHHLYANRFHGYRYELDVESSPPELDYTKINKPSIRPSVFAFDKLEIKDDKLAVCGQSLIYYVDFALKDKINYELYLVKDADVYEKYLCNTLASDLDYKSLLGLDNNCDFICLDGDFDLSKLEKGTYRLYLKIINDKYQDIVEINDASAMLDIEDGRYHLYASNIRNRLVLEVDE